MAASYFPAPESVINAPQTLPTHSTLTGSSHTIHKKCNIDFEKQQAIERKCQLLMEKFNPVPFVPSKNLDFSKHGIMLKMLGLREFAHMEFDKGVRMDLIAELVASYDPQFQCSYVKGTRITVNKDHLARAVKLDLKKSDVVELDLKKDSMEFIVDFLLNWVLLHDEKCLLPGEVVNWVKVIKDRHPEKLDWAGLLWFMVEKELIQGVKLKDCYYASHLQLLIKSQCDEVFLDGESKSWERMTNDLLKKYREEINKRDEEILSLDHELAKNRKTYREEIKKMDQEIFGLERELTKTRKTYNEEIKKRDEKILDLEHKLSENKNLIEHYKEMQNVVAKRKKTSEIPEEARCKEGKIGTYEKFRGVSKQSLGNSWVSQIYSAKFKTVIYLGTYQNPEAGARAYDAALLCLNGKKAKLNFPSSSSIAHLSSSDTVMSIETIKRIAAMAANN